MKGYSQNNEQQAILEIFAGKTTGRFLDIGAFSPFDNSNTRALYELGWSGVMVEPSPGSMRALAMEYGKDERITLIQAAVGNTGGMAPLWLTDDALSTSHDEQKARVENAGYSFYGKILVPQIRIPDVLIYGPYDFVSIDAEGGSALLMLRWLGFSLRHDWQPLPRCFCVEHDFRIPELVAEGEARGYRIALRNGENLIMVKE